ncbi:MAG: agmatinase [Deltaproteobacteria bacterium]|nr:agmatinase [Deltaproteobacteria bacterium]
MNISKIPMFGEPGVRAASADDAQAVVLPVAYEVAPSYGAGTREAPFYILSASEQMEVIDEETMTPWAGNGVHTLAVLEPSNNPEKAVVQIEAAARPHLANGRFLLSIGGDHAVTIGLVSAAAKAFPGIGVLQIDAHLDLRDNWNNSRINHACVMRRIAEDLRLSFVQAGIRAIAPEEAEYIKEKDLSPFFAHALDPFDDSWMDDAIDRLPDQVYLTIDADGLDPSVIPGTGTPEPGGFSYRQIVELVRRLGRRRKVVAADITEVVKIPGTQVSEYTAARIAEKIILYCA